MRADKMLVLFLLAGTVCSRADNHLVTADWNQIKGPTTQLFHECIGAGRANEGLRADWQRQLQLCQDEIGFRQIRFHGLLSDDMGVYAEGRDGRPRHNWQYIDQLYDALLALKIRPFVELSFMPSALASGSKKILLVAGQRHPAQVLRKMGRPHPRPCRALDGTLRRGGGVEMEF